VYLKKKKMKVKFAKKRKFVIEFIQMIIISGQFRILVKIINIQVRYSII